MTRYFFDIRDDGSLVIDDDGVELADIKAAEIEAAESLAEMAKEVAPFEQDQRIAIEVRTADGPAFKATLCLAIAPAGRKE